MYMCYRTGHKELMPLLMNPAPRGKIGRDKDNLIKTLATRPPSFFETPLVRHLTSHSLPFGIPSLARLCDVKSHIRYRASGEYQG